MKKNNYYINIFLLFSFIGIYSCTSTQDQTQVSYRGIDSIIISAQYTSNDLLTYNKFYYDIEGNCIRELKVNILDKDTTFMSQSTIFNDTRKDIIRDKGINIEKQYNTPIIGQDSTTQSIQTYINSPITTYSIEQLLSTKKIDKFITETSISPISDIDTFATIRTYTFNQLISREQFFDPKSKDMVREIIYKYDNNGNILSKAIKNKLEPKVYTYDYKEYYKDGRWKKRDEYINKKLVATETQTIYKTNQYLD